MPRTQENESKRNRAVKRAGDERKQREQKEQEILKLKKQCRERMEEETRLRRDLDEHRRYHDFLTQARAYPVGVKVLLEQPRAGVLERRHWLA